jgi:hypothetical protein
MRTLILKQAAFLAAFGLVLGFLMEGLAGA